MQSEAKRWFFQSSFLLALGLGITGEDPAS